jgi:excisionase family DNA binding protein
MAIYYTVKEVADRFEVTEAAVRDWISKRKIVAIQPSGPNGVYRIPEAAVTVMEQQRAGVRRRRARPIVTGRRVDVYEEKIAQVLTETQSTAEALLRQMATDQGLVARYPSFASDYSAYVQTLAETVLRSSTNRRVRA